MKLLKNENGFSMIELIIVIAIMGVIGLTYAITQGGELDNSRAVAQQTILSNFQSDIDRYVMNEGEPDATTTQAVFWGDGTTKSAIGTKTDIPYFAYTKKTFPTSLMARDGYAKALPPTKSRKVRIAPISDTDYTDDTGADYKKVDKTTTEYRVYKSLNAPGTKGVLILYVENGAGVPGYVDIDSYLNKEKEVYISQWHPIAGHPAFQ